MKYTFFVLGLFFSSLLFSQPTGYKYSSEISSVSGTWNRIIIPGDIFKKSDSQLRDLRIFGFSEKDTLEIPYFIRLMETQEEQNQFPVVILNKSQKGKTYSATLSLKGKPVINHLKLKFGLRNFDLMADLEGSHDQKNWFTLSENQRLISIHNEFTDYSFTELHFPDSDFSYYRLTFHSAKNPDLQQANVLHSAETPGTYNIIPLTLSSERTDAKEKRTEWILTTDKIEPVSFLKLRITSGFDYYRPISIEALADSIKTPNGKIPVYNPICSGIISSLDTSGFRIPLTVSGQFKVTVYNRDNQPLKLISADLKSPVHEAIARFAEGYSFFLFYGNSAKPFPDYDIEIFKNNIPANLNTAVLGNEVLISGSVSEPAVGFLDSPAALWMVMGLLIAGLGFFTLKMIRQKE